MRTKLLFNPQGIYNSRTSSPVQPNVEFWLKVNIGENGCFWKLMVGLMGFEVSESVEAQIYVFMSEPISQRFVDTDCLRDCQDGSENKRVKSM